MGLSKTNNHFYIKIQMPNPSQEPLASSRAPNRGLKDMDVLCTFKMRIQSENKKKMCIKDQRSYQNQDANPHSGAFSILQSPKWGLRGQGCPLHLKNQDREPKYRSWLYQRQVTISKWRSRCQTSARNLQCPPKPKIWTYRTNMFFAPSKER